ncbi:UDP-glucose 6-dehydrogenase [Exophiala dermatitidis]
MDPIPSLLGASEDDSCTDSTGILTPDSSPLFHPLHSKDVLKPILSQILDDANPSQHHNTAFCDFARTERICVIGAGYVGGPTAAVMALHHPAIAVDVLDRDPQRIAQWSSAHLPIHEPGLNNVVRVARDGACASISRRSTGDELGMSVTGSNETLQQSRDPNLFFTTNTADSISRADMIFLAVNTPTKTSGVGAGRATNMTALDGAVKDIARYAKPGAIIVEKSTVPCGTAQRVRQTLTALRPGVPFEVLSNPEFLSEGTAIENLMRPDRVIIGCSDTTSGHAAADALAGLYEAWIPSSRIVKINSWSSELSKLVANAMLAQRISSINSISAICEATGADVGEVASSIGLDVRIGPHFLKAGLGFGGSCFRKDIASLTYLAESLGLHEVAHYWSQVNTMNVLQRDRFARRVVKRFNENMAGRKIAVLGFAFKKDTGDARESLAADVIRALLDEQPAEIAIFDPCCQEADMLREIRSTYTSSEGFPAQLSAVKIHSDPHLACLGANAVLVLTDCDQFRNVRPSRSRSKGRSEEMQSPYQWRKSIPFMQLDTPTNLESNTTTSPTKPMEDESDIFMGYKLAPGPKCDFDCTLCQNTSRKSITTEPIDWARIVQSMRAPKWVFDGRGILDVPALERLGGVKVDVVGRRRPEEGWWC